MFRTRVAAVLLAGAISSPSGVVLAGAATQPAPGLYHAGDGLFALTALGPKHIIFTDFMTGETGQLHASADGRLVAHRANGDSITFRRAGAASSDGDTILWSSARWLEQRATRLPFRREEIAFRNGDVQLSGTLVLPAGRGPFPVVVRLHGAGPADRGNAVDEFFAHHGVAFFSYDKRGVGMSTGDWRTVGVEDLADDAAAAIAMLAKRPEIDSLRIGVGGGSEGGWVAAAVTRRIRNLAFAFVIAGPALSFRDELMAEVRAGQVRMGVAGADLERALAFQQWKMDCIATGTFLTDNGWAAMTAHADSAAKEPWSPALALWPRDSWLWQKFRRMLTFDPTPDWQHYNGPLLALYGGQDLNVPAEPNAAALKHASERPGRAPVNVEIVPRADHDGLDPATRDGDVATFAPGYLDRTLQWVVAHTRRPTTQPVPDPR